MKNKQKGSLEMNIIILAGLFVGIVIFIGISTMHYDKKIDIECRAAGGVPVRTHSDYMNCAKEGYIDINRN